MVAGDHAYVVDGELLVIDISDPQNPRIVGSVDTPGFAWDVTVVGSLAYAADGSAGLSILPIPTEITPVSVDRETGLSVTLPSPSLAGHYTLRVFNGAESDELAGAVTFLENDSYQIQRQKKAIVVAGGGPYAGNHLWEATRTCSHYAYLSLLSQGYTRENVYYLSPVSDVDVDGDGLNNDVDKDTTLANLEYAVATWAQDANDLILYLTDHGGSGTFQLNGTRSPVEMVTAEQLDQWLDGLQATVPGRVVVVYDACRSGSFLPLLCPPEGKERIVVTSSLADEKAWQIQNGVLSFSYQFWASVFLNARLYDSFVVGRNMMERDQTALIDANGNGIGNEKEDKTLAADVVIGRGRIAASTPPLIGSLPDEQVLSGETTAVLWAGDVVSLNPITGVTAYIVPPGFDQGSPDDPVTEVPAVALTDPDGDGVYEGTWDGFQVQGTYRVTVFARDEEGVFSLPKATSVVQTVGPTTGTVVSGTVRTSIGGHEDLPVTNAQLTLEGTAFTTTTDANGAFAFENVPAGDYTLTVTAPSFKTQSQGISVQQGQSQSLDVPSMTAGMYSQEDLDQAVARERAYWDVNGDGKFGMEEVTYGLELVTGKRVD